MPLDDRRLERPGSIPVRPRALCAHAVSDSDAMTKIPKTQATDGVPTYLGRGDPDGRFADYHPAWVEKLASDATLEGSLLDGAVQGADAVLAVIGGARQLYDRQNFKLRRPLGRQQLHRGLHRRDPRRTGRAVHLITFNANGEAQHIIVNYRPLSSLMFFSRLLHKKFAGTPYAAHYLAGEV